MVSRSKRVYRTARSAWMSIARATGLRPSQVRPAHTRKSWVWKRKR